MSFGAFAYCEWLQVYCKMPSPMLGQSCELDVVAGCTDPEAPNYDPMATMDDSSCDIPKPEQLAK